MIDRNNEQSVPVEHEEPGAVGPFLPPDNVLLLIHGDQPFVHPKYCSANERVRDVAKRSILRPNALTCRDTSEVRNHAAVVGRSVASKNSTE